jgi:hypothetical protein
LFAALDKVTKNLMALTDMLDKARAINRDRMMELEEAELEHKKVSPSYPGPAIHLSCAL